MEQDEAGLRTLRAYRKELIEPELPASRPRLQADGDGLLAEFASVVEAVQCAGRAARHGERNAPSP